MAAIILLVLVIAAVGSQLSKSKRKAWIGIKATQLLLLGYGGLLVLLASTAWLVPLNNSTLKIMSDEEIDQNMKLQDEVMSDAFRGTFTEENGLHVVEEWTFPLISEELGITPINTYSVQVFIENSPDIEGEIQVSHYAGKTIVNGFDLTEKRGPLNLNMQGNVLEIKNPQEVSVTLAEISYGFPFQQFTGEEVDPFSNHSFGHMGIDVLYIKAPEGLKIEGDAVYVN